MSLWLRWAKNYGLTTWVLNIPKQGISSSATTAICMFCIHRKFKDTHLCWHMYLIQVLFLAPCQCWVEAQQCHQILTPSYLQSAVPYTGSIVFVPPTSKKLTREIGFRLSMHRFVTLFDVCHILWTVHARVLKFHIWIPHGKIADTCLFSCPSYLPSIWSYASLKKSEWNLMHFTFYEPCMLGFWISFMDSSWKNS